MSYNYFFKINKVEDFWSWATETMAVGLRAGVWYNSSQPYGLAGYLNDYTSRMIGYATLRQIRVKNGMFYVFLSKKIIRINKHENFP